MRSKIAITIVLVLAGIFFFTVTAKSTSGIDQVEMEKYYQQKEAEYVQAAREFLAENGYENSGITLNRVVDTDGTREYTMVIHHRRIDKLSEEEQQSLLYQIGCLAFTDGNCTFRQNLLEN